MVAGPFLGEDVKATAPRSKVFSPIQRSVVLGLAKDLDLGFPKILGLDFCLTDNADFFCDKF